MRAQRSPLAGLAGGRLCLPAPSPAAPRALSWGQLFAFLSPHSWDLLPPCTSFPLFGDAQRVPGPGPSPSPFPAALPLPWLSRDRGATALPCPEGSGGSNGVLPGSQAFRQLSHRFHGKGSGKMKTERRMKKLDEEAVGAHREVAVASGGVGLGGTEALGCSCRADWP